MQVWDDDRLRCEFKGQVKQLNYSVPLQVAHVTWQVLHIPTLLSKKPISQGQVFPFKVLWSFGLQVKQSSEVVWWQSLQL